LAGRDAGGLVEQDHYISKLLIVPEFGRRMNVVEEQLKGNRTNQDM
jgi:hypothetical protein